jgi:deazaflavin-dependent oxidoreductase (nitroreductase family)
MPLPRWIARVNLRLTNRLLGPLARHFPGMGVVLHVGRKTHREYRTPVMVFGHGHHFVIALTYGRDSQWVRNVLAADGGKLETRQHTLRFSRPRLFHDEKRENMPGIIRFFLGVLNVSDFLELTVDGSSAPSYGQAA